MKILIQQAKLYEPKHKLHLQTCDVLIENGIIENIQTEIAVVEDTDILDAKGSWLSVGWMDVGVQIGEPGYEHREDLESVTAAAAAGGFTAIAAFPNTAPVIQSKSGITFLKRFSKTNLVDILPIGAITKDTEGKEITEMYDMRLAGAIAFSDGKKSIQHSGLLLRALEYVKAFDGIIINHPNDNLTKGGEIHEGKISTRLGLKGIPSLSEELMLQRDIELLDYANTRLHVHNISTSESVGMIRRAKERGLNITASVAALQLLLTDDALSGFDTNYKVHPPLREESDRLALIKGVKEGVIDFITSNHLPLEIERKFLEFSYAEFGAIALETAFISSVSALKDELEMEEILEKWTLSSRKAFNLAIPTIKKGEPANLTVFDPKKEWIVKEHTLYSKSKNSPFIGKTLKGKVIFTINNDIIYKHSDTIDNGY